ncbi:MAG: glycosyltransferase family 4 protein [Mariprofundaceae bacterium]
MKIQKHIRVCMTVNQSHSPKTGGEKSNWYLQKGLAKATEFDFELLALADAPFWIAAWRGRADFVFFAFINVWYCYQVMRLKPDIFIEDHYYSRHTLLLNFVQPIMVKMKIFFLVREIRTFQKGFSFSRYAFELALQRSHTIISNSKATEQSLGLFTNLGQKSYVIYPGFDQHAPAEFKRKWDANPVQLLFAGLVKPLKELDLIIQALSKLKDMNWVLRVAGRMDADLAYVAALKAEIEALGLKDRVQFLGMLGKSELMEAYSKAEVFLLPSRNEAFGQVFLEAMSWKLPVIASKSGGAVEIIGDSGGGFLLPAGDAAAWQATVAGLLLDSALRCSMGNRAYKRSKDFGGWDEMVSHFTKLILKRADSK